jgi:hypothetical protein
MSEAKEWVSLYGVEGNLVGMYTLVESGSTLEFGYGTTYTYLGRSGCG